MVHDVTHICPRQGAAIMVEDESAVSWWHRGRNKEELSRMRLACQKTDSTLYTIYHRITEPVLVRARPYNPTFRSPYSHPAAALNQVSTGYSAPHTFVSTQHQGLGL